MHARSGAAGVVVVVLCCAAHCGCGGTCASRGCGCGWSTVENELKNRHPHREGGGPRAHPLGTDRPWPLGGARRFSDCATADGAGAGSPKRRTQLGGGHCGRRASSPAPGPCMRRARLSGSIVSPGSTARCRTAQQTADEAVLNYPKMVFTRSLISCHYILISVRTPPLRDRGGVDRVGHRPQATRSALDSATSRRLPCTASDCLRGRAIAARASTRPHTRLTGGWHYHTH